MPPALLWPITHLGDAAVTQLQTGLLCALLWRLQSRRAGLLLLRAWLLCALLLVLLKLLFINCGQVLGWGLESPSGHACLSTLSWGALATVLWGQWRGSLRGLVSGLAALLIAAIALSRVLLGAHTPAEVVLGGLLGLSALALFARPYLASPPPALRLDLIALVLGAAFALSYGNVLPAEATLRNFAPWLLPGLCEV